MAEIPAKLNTGLRPAVRCGVVSCAFSAVRSVLAVALAYVTKNAIDCAVAGENWETWAILLAVCVTLIPLLWWVSSSYAHRVTDASVCRIRLVLIGELEKKDAGAVAKFHSGALLSRLTDDCRTVTERFTRVMPEIAGELVQLVGAVIVIALMSAKLALAILAFGALAALGGFAMRGILKKHHGEVRSAVDGITGTLTEQLENSEMLRSTAEAGTAVRRTEASHKKWLAARRKMLRLSLGGSALFSLAIQLCYAALIIWGAFEIKNRGMSFGDFTAMLQLAALFRSPIAGLTGAESRLAASDAALERIDEILSMPDEPCAENVNITKVTAVVFENVTFSYDDGERPVFKNFSAGIDLTKWTVLTGMSGRGKSTLYRLLLGLYRPQSGRIYLKTDAGDIDVSAATRKLFTLVPQSPVLFSGTVRENLLIARSDASEDDMRRALDTACCGFIFELPRGLDTPLAQFGEGLSVGQRQRIAIARALMAGGRILLMDEITSALDAETSREVIASLRKTTPAAVFATHRPELVGEADVLHLEDADDE